MKKMEYDYRKIGISHYPWPINPIESVQVAQCMNLHEDGKTKKLLYIHIPFCDSICLFCPYPKSINNETVRKNYLVALAKEIELYSQFPHIKSTSIDAVYFGGGTPSVLTLEEIRFLFETIRKNLNMDSVKEITFEGNPASFTKEKIRTLADFGVNRISLGVQTFHSDLSKNLGMAHTNKDSYQAIKWAKEEGISSVSIDLMYNLPGQTISTWEKDIQIAVDLKVDHITLYPLKVLPKLGLYKKISSGELPTCGDIHQEIDFYLRGSNLLESHGYNFESTYDFCRSGKSHYYSIMHFKERMELLAFGNGAFGQVNGFVYSNMTNVHEYIAALAINKFPVENGYTVAKGDLPSQFMSMGLRLLEIDRRAFFDQFGEYPESLFTDTINKLLSNNLIEITKEKIRLTKTDGYVWGNNICKEFCEQPFKDLLP
jgi:putative oxygen-independent coproporphyrinogen III oxidase